MSRDKEDQNQIPLTNEIFKQLFSLTEKIALLFGGISNVEKSLMKVEEYQSRVVEDNRESNQEVINESKTVRVAIEQLARVSQDVIKVITDLRLSIVSSESSKEDKNQLESTSCKVCDIKSSEIKDLKKVRKILAISVATVIILLLVALGMNFQPIRDVIGIFKH